MNHLVTVYREALKLQKLLFLIEIFIGLIVDSHAVVQKLLLKWQESRSSDLEADGCFSSSSKAVWRVII